MEESNNLNQPVEEAKDAQNTVTSDTPAASPVTSPAVDGVVATPGADPAIATGNADEAVAEKKEEYDIGQSENKSGKGMGWYVVHTYSGYESKVKANIEKAVENRHLESEILEVRVPMEDVVETTKSGQKKTVSKKLFPGYVLVHMDADNNDAWYVVRNTRGVTGFVGPGSKPVPLTEEEMAFMNIGEGQRRIHLDVKEGDTVSVISGVWQDTVGVVKRVDEGKQVVVINVDLFGRETPVEIAFVDVRKM